MKLLILAALVATPALADQYVNGYIRNNGTYVAPHFRTDANDSRMDNYSTRGNTNPYTGERGYKPYEAPAQVETPARSFTSPSTEPKITDPWY